MLPVLKKFIVLLGGGRLRMSPVNMNNIIFQPKKTKTRVIKLVKYGNGILTRL